MLLIGAESDHWQSLSLTPSVTNSVPFRRLDLYHPGVWRCQLKTCWGRYCCWSWWWESFDDSLLQIWKLKFGHKANFLFRLWAQGLVNILKLKFRQDFEVWSIFWCLWFLRRWSWSLVEIMKLAFVKIFNFKFSWDFKAEVWLIFWSWCLRTPCINLEKLMYLWQILKFEQTVDRSQILFYFVPQLSKPRTVKLRQWSDLGPMKIKEDQ